MIRISVQLVSAVSDERSKEIARMHIFNDATGTPTQGIYNGHTVRGRGKKMLDRGDTTRTFTGLRHARLSLHIWHLVAKALKEMGYDK